jgi:hypothetical protein
MYVLLETVKAVLLGFRLCLLFDQGDTMMYILNMKFGTLQMWLSVCCLFFNCAFNITAFVTGDTINNFVDIVIRGSDIGLYIMIGWWALPIVFPLFVAHAAMWNFGKSLAIVYAWLKEFNSISILALPFVGFILFDHLLISFSLPVLYFLLCKKSTSNELFRNMLFIWIGLNSLTALVQIITGDSFGLSFLGESFLTADMTGLARFDQFNLHTLRGYGLTPHPNILGCIGLIGLIHLAHTKKEQVVMLLPILLSGSRAALLGAGIFYILRLPLKKWLSLSIGILASLFAIVLNQRSSDVYRIQDATRFVDWYSQLPWFNKIFGVGLGQYSVSVERIFPTLEKWQFQPVHSIPLLLLSELGFVGIICIGWMLWQKLKWYPKVTTTGV